MSVELIHTLPLVIAWTDLFVVSGLPEESGRLEPINNTTELMATRFESNAGKWLTCELTVPTVLGTHRGCWHIMPF